jgi:hypothetical protein
VKGRDSAPAFPARTTHLGVEHEEPADDAQEGGLDEAEAVGLRGADEDDEEGHDDEHDDVREDAGHVVVVLAAEELGEGQARVGLLERVVGEVGDKGARDAVVPAADGGLLEGVAHLGRDDPRELGGDVLGALDVDRCVLPVEGELLELEVGREAAQFPADRNHPCLVCVPAVRDVHPGGEIVVADDEVDKVDARPGVAARCAKPKGVGGGRSGRGLTAARECSRIKQGARRPRVPDADPAAEPKGGGGDPGSGDGAMGGSGRQPRLPDADPAALAVIELGFPQTGLGEAGAERGDGVRVDDRRIARGGQHMMIALRDLTPASRGRAVAAHQRVGARRPATPKPNAPTLMISGDG